MNTDRRFGRWPRPARPWKSTPRFRCIPQVLAWWREEGGQAITFASDAHEPAALAAGFAEAARLADAAAFSAGRDPAGFWHRKRFLAFADI